MIVKDGIVTLEGEAETSDFGHDIVQRVRHVPGVVAVRDRLGLPASRAFRAASSTSWLASPPTDASASMRKE